MASTGCDIEELARRTGATTRNLRAYQTAGLLPPPVRAGRRVHYGPEHVRHLAVIERLRTCRYSLAAIRDLLAAWDAGKSLGDVLGLEPGPPSAGTWVDELFAVADLGVDPHSLAPSLN